MRRAARGKGVRMQAAGCNCRACASRGGTSRGNADTCTHQDVSTHRSMHLAQAIRAGEAGGEGGGIKREGLPQLGAMLLRISRCFCMSFAMPCCAAHGHG
jgi:hypothetical protein